MTDTTGPMTLEQAAESLLIPNEPEQQEDVAEVEEDLAEDEIAEEDGAEELEETEAEGESEEADEDDSEADLSEDEDEDAEVEAEEKPRTYTVKADGVETEVTLEELTQAYSGQAHIQKGMQEAAEQKKQAEAVFNALQQEQARIAQLYQTMQQGGVMQAPQAPDLQMAKDDPIGYITAKAEYDAQKVAFDEQQNQFSQMTQQQTQAQQAAMQAYLQEQKQVLAREIPEFADAEKGKLLMSELRSTGQSYGFSEDELGQIQDARTVKVLHDAMKYRKLQANKGAVEKKVQKARPVTKPKAPRKVNVAEKRRIGLQKQLKETGSVDAAIQLLMDN